MNESTLFYNGKIYLGNKKFGCGFVVTNKRFSKIFYSENEINLNLFSNKINLKNKFVMPGLIDTHTHLLLEAQKIKSISFKKINNFNKLKKVINKKIAKDNPKFICFDDFDENKFISKRILNRFDLDLICNKVPIFIFRIDLHMVMTNTIGLEFLNLFKKNITSSYGPEIVLDSVTKLPLGIIKENAVQELRKKISSFYDLKSDYKNLVLINQSLIKMGISSVVTCDILEDKEDYIYSLYERLVKENSTVKIKHQIVFYNKKKLISFLKSKNEKSENEFNKIIDIKIFNDGSLGSKTAFLQKHYCDNKNNFGILNYQINDLNGFFKIAQKYKKQVAIHSIGDASSLNCIQAIKKFDKNNLHRYKLIHFQLFDKKMLDLVAKNNILLSVQPCFLENDLPILNEYVQKSIALTSYNFNKIFEKNNQVISFSTDAPVCELNPWKNLLYSIHGNQISKPKNSEKTFSIFDAIKCYTENAAYSFFEENQVGKISVNFFADFIVLNQNIFSLKKDSQILKTKVLSHYINGKKVY